MSSSKGNKPVTPQVKPNTGKLVESSFDGPRVNMSKPTKQSNNKKGK